MTEDRNQYVRDAIALMTAWLDESHGGRFALETLEQILNDRSPHDHLVGLEDLVAGLIGLCGDLLSMREEETGITMAESLRELGQGRAG